MHGVAFGYAPTYLQDDVYYSRHFITMPHVSLSVGSTAFSVAGPQSGTDFPHHSGILIVRLHLRNIYKQYFCWRFTTSYQYIRTENIMVTYHYIFSQYPFYILLLIAVVHFAVRDAIEIF